MASSTNFNLSARSELIESLAIQISTKNFQEASKFLKEHPDRSSISETILSKLVETINSFQNNSDIDLGDVRSKLNGAYPVSNAPPVSEAQAILTATVKATAAPALFPAAQAPTPAAAPTPPSAESDAKANSALRKPPETSSGALMAVEAEVKTKAETVIKAGAAASASTSSSAASTFLDWTKRPPTIKEQIDLTFSELSKEIGGAWVYNGKASYGACSIDPVALVKKILDDAPPQQKDVYVLDIGGGDGQWGKSLVSAVQSLQGTRPDITVHVINVIGELLPDGSRYQVATAKNCKVHSLGGFKVEEIQTAFKQFNLPLENSVDLIVSSWCFRHLIDPVGTFVQTYNLLRPKTGMLLMDGFFFSTDHETSLYDRFGLRSYSQHEENQALLARYNENMTRLLLDIKAPFLMGRDDDYAGSLNRFMLKRPDNTPCQVPLQYKGMSSFRCEINEKRLVNFKREGEIVPVNHVPRSYVCLLGDNSLFKWCQDSQLFKFSGMEWQPIKKVAPQPSQGAVQASKG